MNCDEILTDISFITSVASDRYGVFELLVISSSSICYDSWLCCSMKSINSSSGCSKIWSDLSNFAWSLVSNQYSEDIVSKLRVTILFLIFSDENLFGSIFFSPLNSINYSSGCSKLWLDVEILSWNFLSKLYSEYGCSEVIVSTSFGMFLLCLDES